MENLQEAYLSVYQELDEVRGGGAIDPVSNFPHHSERGSRRPEDAGLKMSPLDRAEARQNALRKRGTPEATKRANRIGSRFVGPTKRGLSRAIDAANNARFAEKKRLTQSEEFDLFDYLLEYLVAEGYADTNQNAIAIMANMSEEWKENIIEAAKDQSDKQLDRAMKTTYKAQNTIDNQHQGRMGKRFDSLPASERQAKTDRMNARLKARRSDVSGEQNRRSDEKTEKLKKLLGL